MIADFPILKDTRPLVGIVGTGFVARHFALELWRRRNWDTAPRLAGYLTRRDPAGCDGLPNAEKVTTSVEQLLSSSDLIFECSGDPYWATEIVAQAMAAGKPVMTLNPEFHVTTGSYFASQGYLTEADGDQPGCLASLREEALAMGFVPLVYGNMKGFLNHTPSPADMAYWGAKQGISETMVTSFTDGTKLQIEQVLVGNAFDADIEVEGMSGPEGQEGLAPLAEELALLAECHGRPITDYVLSRNLPHGVFITATHDQAQAAALAYIKLGEGPHYSLMRNNIFVHLEPFKTIERMQRSATPLLANSQNPHLSVAAVAKRDLVADEFISQGCGSYDMRGVAVRIADRPGHLPIGLAKNLHLKRRVEAGAIIQLDDVELAPHRAIELWQDIEKRSLNA